MVPLLPGKVPVAMRETPTYVLSNELGTVLATYGSALQDMATTRAREIATETGCRVALHFISCRPAIGASISMRGTLTWF